jgi:hypothetical protein
MSIALKPLKDFLWELQRNAGHVVLWLVLHRLYTGLFPVEQDTRPLFTTLGFTIACWQVVLWTVTYLFYWLGTDQ